MTADAAVLSSHVGLLAPVDDVELPEATLPGFGGDRAGIDAPRGLQAAAALRSHRTGRDGRVLARCIPDGAVHGARHTQIRRKRVGFGRVQDGSIRTTRVQLSAVVVDHMHASSAEARGIRFDDIEIEQGEGFVEMGFTRTGAEQSVVELSVPHADAEWNLNQSRAGSWVERPVSKQVGAARASRIHEGAVPQVRLPGEGAIVHIASAD